MSVTIKGSKLNYKDSQGNYVGVDVVAERSTEDIVSIVRSEGVSQVNAVSSAGSTAIANIQTKEDEALAQLANAAEVRDMIAGVFNSNTAYTAGQYVIQTVTVSGSSVNKLFRFKVDHAAGAWDDSEVIEVKLADDVADLKSALDEIRGSSKNLFNPWYFTNYSGFTKNGEEISAKATTFANTFWDEFYPFDDGVSFEENTQYTLSFQAKTNGSDGTSGNGLTVYIYFTDDTEIHEGISNAASSFVSKIKVTPAGKTVKGIKFTYSYGPTNVWTIKNIQFEKGFSATPFETHYTAEDIIARQEIDGLVIGDIIDPNNLLCSAEKVMDKYYVNGAEQPYAGVYEYYIFPVVSGTTYHFYPGARFLCKSTGASLVEETSSPFDYTADFTGNLYLTLWQSGHPGKKVTSSTNPESVLPLDVLQILYNSGNNANSKFVGKKILNIGDSIAENRTNSHSYSHQFADATGAIITTDYALGGSTLSLASDQGTRGCIYSQALKAVTDNPNAGYDIIMVDGVANDFGLNRPIGTITGTVGQYEISDYTATFDETTVLGALEAIFKMLRNQYVSSIIVFVIPHKNDRTGAIWEEMLDGIRNVCDKWSIPILDMDRYGELNSRIVAMRTDYTDEGGTHPNTAGIKKYFLPLLIDLLSGYFE